MAIVVASALPSTTAVAVTRSNSRYLLTDSNLHSAFSALLTAYDIYVRGNGEHFLLVEGHPGSIRVCALPGITIDCVLRNTEPSFNPVKVQRNMREYQGDRDVALWVELLQRSSGFDRRYRCAVYYGTE